MICIVIDLQAYLFDKEFPKIHFVHFVSVRLCPIASPRSVESKGGGEKQVNIFWSDILKDGILSYRSNIFIDHDMYNRFHFVGIVL